MNLDARTSIGAQRRPRSSRWSLLRLRAEAREDWDDARAERLLASAEPSRLGAATFVAARLAHVTFWRNSLSGELRSYSYGQTRHGASRRNFAAWRRKRQRP
jgi:hypothetical protein